MYPISESARAKNPHFFRAIETIRGKKKKFLVVAKIGNTIKKFISEANTIGEMEGKIKKRYPIAETQEWKEVVDDLFEI